MLSTFYLFANVTLRCLHCWARPALLAGLQHFNVRKWHKGLYDNQQQGLKQTVEAMGLVWQGTYHRGIDDANNVASIIKEMLG